MLAMYTNIKKWAACTAGCFFLLGCENKIEDVRAINADAVGKDVATNVTIRYSTAGKKKAVLTSPIMYRVLTSDSYVEFPNTIHVDFFNATGDSLESKLDARYAKYQDNRSIVFLKDSVRVINIMGDTLYCHELYWDRSKTNQEFYTDKPVRIRRKMEIIDGIGLDARQDFKEWHIVQPVGFIKVPGSQFPN
ncbi:MAG: export transporter periplasmic protein LptC [Bacteroidota bacterium]|jgi:LPS export ABC transporter protein LptC